MRETHGRGPLGHEETYLRPMLAHRDSIALSEDPAYGRTPRRPRSAPAASGPVDRSGRDEVAARAREAFLALPWDERYERQALADLAGRAGVALDSAELLARIHAGRREVLCYSESGAEFEVKALRPGKRHIEVFGDAFARVELPGRGSDDFYCRVGGQARAFVLSGQVYAEHRAYLEAGAHARVHLFDDATGLADAMGCFAYCHGRSRLELRRAHQVRADEQAVVAVDPETARGEIALYEEATVIDSRSGETLVTVPDLVEGENTRGNARWLRGEELTCYHWAWNGR